MRCVSGPALLGAASEAALADLRRGSERMTEEFAKAYAQAFGQFAT